MKPYRIRMFTETCCEFALWGDIDRPLPGSEVVPGTGELEGLLPISDRLRERLLAWADYYRRHESGAVDVSMSGFDETGMWLSRELQGELGPEYSVGYHFTFAGSGDRLKPVAIANALPGWSVR